MKKILYANGESLTFGMEILGDYSYLEENKQSAWPAALARLAGIDQVLNRAHCGASNEFIHKRTIIDLTKMAAEGQDPRETVVAIGWSSICRQEIYIRDQVQRVTGLDLPLGVDFAASSGSYQQWGTIFMNPGFNQWLRSATGQQVPIFDQLRDQFTEYVWNDQMEYEKWAVLQLSLADYLDQRGYSWVMFNAVHAHDDRMLTPAVRAALNRKGMYRPDWSMLPWVDRFYSANKRACGHPASDAHAALARLLHLHMRQQGLID